VFGFAPGFLDLFVILGVMSAFDARMALHPKPRISVATRATARHVPSSADDVHRRIVRV